MSVITPATNIIECSAARICALCVRDEIVRHPNAPRLRERKQGTSSPACSSRTALAYADVLGTLSLPLVLRTGLHAALTRLSSADERTNELHPPLPGIFGDAALSLRRRFPNAPSRRRRSPLILSSTLLRVPPRLLFFCMALAPHCLHFQVPTPARTFVAPPPVPMRSAPQSTLVPHRHSPSAPVP